MRQGEEHLASQRAIVERLEAEGQATENARDLLTTFGDSQQMHRRNLARAEAELAALVAEPSA